MFNTLVWLGGFTSGLLASIVNYFGGNYWASFWSGMSAVWATAWWLKR